MLCVKDVFTAYGLTRHLLYTSWKDKAFTTHARSEPASMGNRSPGLPAYPILGTRFFRPLLLPAIKLLPKKGTRSDLELSPSLNLLYSLCRV